MHGRSSPEHHLAPLACGGLLEAAEGSRSLPGLLCDRHERGQLLDLLVRREVDVEARLGWGWVLGEKVLQLLTDGGQLGRRLGCSMEGWAGGR
jgi:hypothetical protein